MNKLAIKDLYKIKFYLDGFDPSNGMNLRNNLRFMPFIFCILFLMRFHIFITVVKGYI